MTATSPTALRSAAEKTTTIVIGTGFSALAVAAELNRQGVAAIVVDSFCPLNQAVPSQPATGGISLDDLSERSEVLRILEHYARRHSLDIRPSTQAMELSCQIQQGEAAQRQWRVRTGSGTLSAHTLVFTRGALSQLRRVLHAMGVTSAADVRASMQSLGLYLVGVGDLALPSTVEILHQAKRAAQSIKSRVALPQTSFTFA